MPHRQHFWAGRPLAVLLLAGTLLGALTAVAGLVLDAVVVQAAGAALGAALLPATIVQIAGGEDQGDDGWGAGPDDPLAPEPGPYPGLDWDEFDETRLRWERTHARASARLTPAEVRRGKSASSTGTPPT